MMGRPSHSYAILRSLQVLALALAVLGFAAACGKDNSKSSASGNSKNNTNNKNANAGDSNGGEAAGDPATGFLQEFADMTDAERDARTKLPRIAQSLGGKIPLNDRGPEEIAAVICNPKIYVAARDALDELLAEQDRKMSRHVPVIKRHADTMTRLVQEARSKVLSGPRGEDIYATETGFKIASSDKDVADPKSFPMFAKAMSLIFKGDYAEAFAVYDFGADFPEAMVSEREKDVYRKTTFPGFRERLLFAVCFNTIEGKVRGNFDRGNFSAMFDLMDVKKLSPMTTKAIEGSQIPDWYAKADSAFIKMRQIWETKSRKKFEEVIGPFQGKFSSMLSGGEPVPPAAQLDALLREAEAKFAEVKKWGVEKFNSEYEANLKMWREQVETLKKKPR